MNAEQIQQFLATKVTGKDKYVKIDFKTRHSVYGLFITEGRDYKDLSSKNFWRIVTRKHFDEYNKSKSLDLTRIFNGSEFTKLSLLAEAF
ncbi:MAG TPA: short-chain dehydrogenase [Chitinophagaceae bacterium]|nr:short-chain dehydrogenase [Chitinophagaceae bacterium]